MSCTGRGHRFRQPSFSEVQRSALREVCATLLTLILLAGCGSTSERANVPTDPSASVPGYKVGKPYRINGVWYYPSVDYDYREIGVASWYGPGFHGRSTANGEAYDMNDLTAAHRTLPMPSIVRVTNLENGRSIKLRVNDRGPFVGNRIIDVSRRAAQLLGFHIGGTARVLVENVAEESKQLAAALGVRVDTAMIEHPTEQPFMELASANEISSSTPEISSAMPTSPIPEPEIQSEPQIGQAAMMAVTALQEPPASSDPEMETFPRINPAIPQTERRPELKVASIRYVQAGAFADVDRADFARRRLSRIGPIVMSPSRVNGRELLRVRVGPLFSDDEAERVLASVSQAGFPDCLVVNQVSGAE
jgi:peptidoglycan lytic transglycosylase